LTETTATQLITVLIADDHEPTRADVRRMLERDGRFAVSAEAADAPGAVARAMETRAVIALLDIRMPGSGLSALWEISARLPATKIVMLTVSEEGDDLFAALRAGAHGYLLKDVDPRRLPEALHDVYDGTPAIPRALVAVMMEEFRDANPRRRAIADSDELGARLTSREWQVLHLLASDLSTAEIAERLVLTQSAVRAHIAAIVRKSEVENRTEAIAQFRARSEI
jgi:DNA-binding NarL/FixJ family response regulator